MNISGLEASEDHELSSSIEIPVNISGLEASADHELYSIKNPVNASGPDAAKDDLLCCEESLMNISGSSKDHEISNSKVSSVNILGLEATKDHESSIRIESPVTIPEPTATKDHELSNSEENPVNIPVPETAEDHELTKSKEDSATISGHEETKYYELQNNVGTETTKSNEESFVILSETDTNEDHEQSTRTESPVTNATSVSNDSDDSNPLKDHHNKTSTGTLYSSLKENVNQSSEFADIDHNLEDLIDGNVTPTVETRRGETDDNIQFCQHSWEDKPEVSDNREVSTDEYAIKTDDYNGDQNDEANFELIDKGQVERTSSGSTNTSTDTNDTGVTVIWNPNYSKSGSTSSTETEVHNNRDDTHPQRSNTGDVDLSPSSSDGGSLTNEDLDGSDTSSTTEEGFDDETSVDDIFDDEIDIEETMDQKPADNLSLLENEDVGPTGIKGLKNALENLQADNLEHEGYIQSTEEKSYHGINSPPAELKYSPDSSTEDYNIGNQDDLESIMTMESPLCHNSPEFEKTVLVKQNVQELFDELIENIQLKGEKTSSLKFPLSTGSSESESEGITEKIEHTKKVFSPDINADLETFDNKFSEEETRNNTEECHDSIQVFEQNVLPVQEGFSLDVKDKIKKETIDTDETNIEELKVEEKEFKSKSNDNAAVIKDSYEVETEGVTFDNNTKMDNMHTEKELNNSSNIPAGNECLEINTQYALTSKQLVENPEVILEIPLLITSSSNNPQVEKENPLIVSDKCVRILDDTEKLKLDFNELKNVAEESIGKFLCLSSHNNEETKHIMENGKRNMDIIEDSEKPYVCEDLLAKEERENNMTQDESDHDLPQDERVHSETQDVVETDVTHDDNDHNLTHYEREQSETKLERENNTQTEIDHNLMYNKKEKCETEDKSENSEPKAEREHDEKEQCEIQDISAYAVTEDKRENEIFQVEKDPNLTHEREQCETQNERKEYVTQDSLENNVPQDVIDHSLTQYETENFETQDAEENETPQHERFNLNLDERDLDSSEDEKEQFVNQGVLIHNSTADTSKHDSAENKIENEDVKALETNLKQSMVQGKPLKENNVKEVTNVKTVRFEEKVETIVTYYEPQILETTPEDCDSDTDDTVTSASIVEINTKENGELPPESSKEHALNEYSNYENEHILINAEDNEISKVDEVTGEKTDTGEIDIVEEVITKPVVQQPQDNLFNNDSESKSDLVVKNKHDSVTMPLTGERKKPFHLGHRRTDSITKEKSKNDPLPSTICKNNLEQTENIIVAVMETTKTSVVPVQEALVIYKNNVIPATDVFEINKKGIIPAIEAVEKNKKSSILAVENFLMNQNFNGDPKDDFEINKNSITSATEAIKMNGNNDTVLEMEDNSRGFVPKTSRQPFYRMDLKHESQNSVEAQNLISTGDDCLVPVKAGSPFQEGSPELQEGFFRKFFRLMAARRKKTTMVKKDSVEDVSNLDYSDDISNDGSDISEIYLRRIREDETPRRFKYSEFDKSPFEELGMFNIL